MATQTKENIKKAASIVREEDLQDLQEFQKDIEEKISRAREDGRVYMMQQYVRIMASVTTEVKKISARFERERIAAHNNELKALKKEAKEKSDEEEGAA